MFPTIEHIQVAAYHLWERRGRSHGRDREDWQTAEKQLIYNLNYETVREFGLLEPAPMVLGQAPTRRCRFCERDSKRVRFGPPLPVVPIVPNSSLLTAEVCRECQAECREPLSGDLARFWEWLTSEGAARDGNARRFAVGGLSLGGYKALVAAALLILPEREIPYFHDTIEWVGNPDPDADERLFAGATCRAYLVPEASAGAWFSLATRTDDDAMVPYMIALLSWGRAIVQFQVPLCSRDDDLDGRWPPLLEHSFAWGNGWSFRQASSRLLPLLLPGDRGRAQAHRRFVEC